MKQKIKISNILISIVLLLAAFVCLTNATYSYFSATDNKSGNVKFDTLNVAFGYIEPNGSSIVTPSGTTQINLFSASGPIQREVEFDLSLSNGGAVIDDLGIQNLEGCSAYVRFWIDAYIVKNNVVQTNENYGKYFFLDDSITTGSGDPAFTREDSSVQGSWCYYLTNKLSSGSSGWSSIGTKMILKDVPANGSIPKAEVPVELLGQQLKITITLQAVQADNDAYLSVFGKTGDTKGYYTGWGESDEW